MKGIYFDGNKGRMDRSRILIVEGVDDAFFLESLLDFKGASPDQVGICYVEGKTNFEPFLRGFLKSSAFTKSQIGTYAVIRDADDDHVLAQREIKSIMLKLGEPEPNFGGFSIRSDGRRVGTYIFPEDNQDGDLEELCMRTVEGQQLAREVEQNFIGIERKFGPFTQRYKRMSQSYLSVANGELCRGAGRGMKNGRFDKASPSLTGIYTFLDHFLS